MEIASGKSKEKAVIREGSALIESDGHVFYNPVQEFNRDCEYLLKAYVKWPLKSNPRGFVFIFSEYFGAIQLFQAFLARAGI